MMSKLIKINKDKLHNAIDSAGFENHMAFIAVMPLSQSSYDKFNREGWPAVYLKAAAYVLDVDHRRLV